MILSDRNIRAELKTGQLIITPAPLEGCMQPASVDLRLGNTQNTPRGRQIIDRSSGLVPDQGLATIFEELWLLPGRFANVSTLEWIEIPSYLIGILAGKSTLARDGLQVESAGYVDPGWRGRLTLELKNLGPDTIILRPGMRICQLRFEKMLSRPKHLYGDPDLSSHYQGSEQAQAGFRPEPGTASLFGLPETPPES